MANVRVLTLDAVGRVYDSRSGQTKGYTMDICSFSFKHESLSGKG